MSEEGYPGPGDKQYRGGGAPGPARENTGNVNSASIMYNLKIQVCAMQLGRHNDTKIKWCLVFLFLKFGYLGFPGGSVV